MTPQERQLIDDLFDRLAKLEDAPRDPEAMSAIMDGLRKAPNGVYALVQTALVQDEALKRANDRIQQMEEALGGEQHQQSGGFLDSMRDAIFGQGQSQQRGSVPPVRAPDMGRDPGGRPVWNTGQAMQQSQPPGPGYGQPQYGQPQYGQPQYGQPYGSPFGGGGGGGSFLGTAAAAAAGVVGGGLLLNSIRGMMGGGGSHQAFADAGSPATPTGRGATSPAAIWHATPGSTTSARRADAATLITARAQACSIRRRMTTTTPMATTISTALTTMAAATTAAAITRDLKPHPDAKRPLHRAAVLFWPSGDNATIRSPPPSRRH